MQLTIQLRSKQIEKLYKKRKVWVCRSINGKPENILVREYDVEAQKNAKVEKLKAKLAQIQELIAKESGTVQKRNIKRNKACKVCGKRFKRPSLHQKIAHGGFQSNLPHLRLKVVENA